MIEDLAALRAEGWLAEKAERMAANTERLPTVLYRTPHASVLQNNGQTPPGSAGSHYTPKNPSYYQQK